MYSKHGLIALALLFASLAGLFLQRRHSFGGTFKHRKRCFDCDSEMPGMGDALKCFDCRDPAPRANSPPLYGY